MAELFPSMGKGLALTFRAQTKKEGLLGGRCDGRCFGSRQRNGVGVPTSEHQEGCTGEETAAASGVAWPTDRQRAHTTACPQEERRPSAQVGPPPIACQGSPREMALCVDGSHRSSFRPSGQHVLDPS